ncbi:hypothetical protein [Micrococcus endophyticus]|uniref:hypothetical protein n=1 Tax=Micrococcus endophyticus TaxID=455343 RepID=UPI0034CF8FCF
MKFDTARCKRMAGSALVSMVGAGAVIAVISAGATAGPSDQAGKPSDSYIQEHGLTQGPDGHYYGPGDEHPTVDDSVEVLWDGVQPAGEALMVIDGEVADMTYDEYMSSK